MSFYKHYCLFLIAIYEVFKNFHVSIQQGLGYSIPLNLLSDLSASCIVHHRNIFIWREVNRTLTICHFATSSITMVVIIRLMQGCEIQLH